jgi:hypothetical protein
MKTNKPLAELRAISQLRKDHSTKILPAEKGNASVIIDTEQYNNKISELILSRNYSTLNKDPTTTTERKVYNTLKKQ